MKFIKCVESMMLNDHALDKDARALLAMTTKVDKCHVKKFK